MPSVLPLAAIVRPSRTTTACKCTCINAARRIKSLPARGFTTTRTRLEDIGGGNFDSARIRRTDENAKPPGYPAASRKQAEYKEQGTEPRWLKTPERMIAPYRSRPLPNQKPHPVNSDPRRLDQVYLKVLGPGGDKILSDEVKWLAVTHKSFDHGRRGYNERLAFFGMRSRLCQWNIAILSTAE